MYDFIWSQVRSVTKMLQRIKSVLEVTWRRCYDVSRASWKLLEEDVTTYQERLGSCLKKMLRRIKSVLEVPRRRRYDVSRASWKLLEEDVTTYQERLGSYLKKMLRHIRSVLEATWRRRYDVSRASWKLLEDRWRRCCNVAMLQRLWNADERTLLHPPKPPFNPPKARHLQKWQQSRPSRGAAAINYPSKTITIRD